MALITLSRSGAPTRPTVTLDPQPGAIPLCTRKRTKMNDSVDQSNVTAELEAVEIQEWLDSLDYVLQHGGAEHVRRLLQHLQVHAQKAGVDLPFSANTPYINTIPADKQPLFPGSREI